MAQQNAINSISPDQSTSIVHLVRFCGFVIKTTVTADPSVAVKWISQVLSMERQKKPIKIAVTAESNQNSERIATIQLSLKKRCLVLQLAQMDRETSEAIRSLFLDETIFFYGFKMENIESKLFSDYGIKFRRRCELRETCDIYVKFAKIVMISSGDSTSPLCYDKLRLKDLAKGLLGVHLKRPKHVRESDWEGKELTEGQIKCATKTGSVAFSLANL